METLGVCMCACVSLLFADFKFKIMIFCHFTHARKPANSNWWPVVIINRYTANIVTVQSP